MECTSPVTQMPLPQFPTDEGAKLCGSEVPSHR